MKFKYPHIYAIMAMVDKKDYKYLQKYKKELSPNVQFFMKKENFDNVAPQHISLCYFSYPEKYSCGYIEKLVPKINEIAKKYLPMKIKVKGLLGAWELGWESPILADHESPVIMWDISKESLKKIKSFRDDLVLTLKDKIEHFNDPDLEFTPHIGIALGKQEKMAQLKEIVKKSKSDAEITINISSLQIYFPNGPRQILQ